jgi:hypothetical protein
MIRCSFLFRAINRLANRKLYHQLNESLENFELSNTSEITEFLEIIKEKGFNLKVSKTSKKIVLEKMTQNGKLSILSMANPTPEVNENMKKILNPKNDKNLNFYLDLSKKQKQRLHPAFVTVAFEVGDQVMVAEIFNLLGEVEILSMIILDADGFKLKKFYQYEGFKPETKNFFKMKGFLHSWITRIGVEADVISRFVKFSDFHYDYMCKNWMERVKKSLS